MKQHSSFCLHGPRLAGGVKGTVRLGPGGKGQGAIAINLILSHGKQNIEGLFSMQRL